MWEIHVQSLLCLEGSEPPSLRRELELRCWGGPSLLSPLDRYFVYTLCVTQVPHVTLALPSPQYYSSTSAPQRRCVPGGGVSVA